MDNCKRRTIIHDDDTPDTKKPRVSILQELPFTPSITSFTLPDDITCNMINIIFQRLLDLYTTNAHLYVFDIIKVDHVKFTIKANVTTHICGFPISCRFKVYLFKTPNKDNILIDMMRRFNDCIAFNHVYNYTRFYFNIN